MRKIIAIIDKADEKCWKFHAIVFSNGVACGALLLITALLVTEYIMP